MNRIYGTSHRSRTTALSLLVLGWLAGAAPGGSVALAAPGVPGPDGKLPASHSAPGEGQVPSLPLAPATAEPNAAAQEAPDAAGASPSGDATPTTAGAAGGSKGDDELSHVRQELAQQRALLQALLAREAAASAPGTPGSAQAGSGDASAAQHAPAAGSPAPAEPAGGHAAPASGSPGAAGTASGADHAAPATDASAPAIASPSGVSPAAGPSAPADGFASDADRRAYASGVSLGRELQQSLAQQRSVGLVLSPALVLAGLEDSYGGHPLRMSDDMLHQVLQGLSEDFSSRMQARRTEEVEKGRDFRTAFRKQKGVVSDAGSLYLIDKKGFGRLRTPDLATLQITGRLPDGTVFDGSGEAGQVRKVKVGAMLPAIAIGLQKIGVGGHITIVVPPEKGYGDMGQPPAVPGGATLIFDITVKGVNEGS